MVKSLKYHLRRTMGNIVFTFQDLTTLSCQIEACLNSRALSKISDYPSDSSYLTPSHFLVGEPITAVPDIVLLIESFVFNIYRRRLSISGRNDTKNTSTHFNREPNGPVNILTYVLEILCSSRMTTYFHSNGKRAQSSKSTPVMISSSG